jgi:hypothetical protein
MNIAAISNVVDILKLFSWVDHEKPHMGYERHSHNLPMQCEWQLNPMWYTSWSYGQGLIASKSHGLCISFALFTHAMEVAAESHVVDFVKFRTWVDCVTFTWDIYTISAIYPCYGSSSCIPCGRHLEVSEMGLWYQWYIDYVFHYHIFPMWWK